MHFTVEEENLICMYHNADRRRTIGRITAALPDMDEGMQTLAQQILSKLERMTDADYEVPSSIMRKFIYKSGRTQSAQGRGTCP